MARGFRRWPGGGIHNANLRSAGGREDDRTCTPGRLAWRRGPFLVSGDGTGPPDTPRGCATHPDGRQRSLGFGVAHPRRAMRRACASAGPARLRPRFAFDPCPRGGAGRTRRPSAEPTARLRVPGSPPRHQNWSHGRDGGPSARMRYDRQARAGARFHGRGKESLRSPPERSAPAAALVRERIRQREAGPA